MFGSLDRQLLSMRLTGVFLHKYLMRACLLRIKSTAGYTIFGGRLESVYSGAWRARRITTPGIAADSVSILAKGLGQETINSHF